MLAGLCLAGAAFGSDELDAVIQVVHRNSMQAVGRASVGVREAVGEMRRLEADADGQLKLRVVSGRRYYVEAERPDFVKSPVTVFVPVEGASLLVLPLTPVASISGVVRDSDGIPLGGVDIAAMRRVYSRGRPDFEIAERARTAVDGEYKFAGLVPGTYYVRALYRGTYNENSIEGYRLAFYPIAPDPESAAPVAAIAGERTSGIDIRLTRGSLAVVRGRVLGGDKNPIAGTTVVLYPLDYGGPDYSRAKSQRTTDRGAFAFTNVVRGVYFVVAQEHGASVARVEVTDEAPEVVVQSGLQSRMDGHVRWKDTPPGAVRPGSIEIGLNPVEFPLEARPRSRADTSGAFQLAGWGTGSYSLVVTGLPAGAFVDSVTYGNQELSELTLQCDPAVPVKLDIAISPVGGSLTVRVTTHEGQAAYQPLVTLIPESGRLADFRMDRADETGVARISGIRPGTYRVIAWTNVVPGAYQNAAYMKNYDSATVALVIEKGGNKALDLVAVDGQ